MRASTPGLKATWNQQSQPHHRNARRTPKKKQMNSRRSAGRCGSSTRSAFRCVLERMWVVDVLIGRDRGP